MSAIAMIVIWASATKPAWHELSGYTFDRYTLDYGKNYRDASELGLRQSLFEAKLAEVDAHNHGAVKYSWKKGINHLSDRTPEELKAMRGLNKALLFSQKREREAIAAEAAPPPPPTQPPKMVDWRNHSGVLTAVKNQGQCGSCWTFASTETIESQWFLKTGYTEDLSEQFILDCTPNPKKCGGTGGCDGGTAELAYARLKELGGIPSEYTYPYVSGMGANSTCKGTFPLQPQQPHSGGESAAALVTGFVNVASNSFDDVTAAVANIGPLAISVDAGAWHDYETGIFSGGNMTNPDLDHLVQLVGYGEDEDGDYWIVRNSWTPQWGQKGFIYLNRTAACGTDITPLDGNGCAGGPSSMKVCGQSGMLFDAIYPLVQ